MDRLWKENWDETKHHFNEWWNQRGMVLTVNGAINQCPPRGGVTPPPPTADAERKYTDAAWLAQHRRHELSQNRFVADGLPISDHYHFYNLLSHLLGAVPHFKEDTIENEPCVVEPESHPPFAFDPGNRWWRNYEAIARADVAAGDGNYFGALPLLMNDLDTLCALRGIETLMMDFVDHPEWVRSSLAQINAAFKEAYQRIYDIDKLEDGSSFCQTFQIWGPGKVMVLQSDASALLSPAMFDDFVIPHLVDLTTWLDHTLYHLDGVQALRHLDSLLAVKKLHAIQWMSGAGQPSHGDKSWYPLYQRILTAGKSVQICWISQDEVEPLLDAIGTKGVYLLVNDVNTEKEYERLLTLVGR